MKIYTKKGDKGYTQLLSGRKVKKYDLRVEAYGLVDELTSHIGFLRSYELPDNVVSELIEVQRVLFNISGLLSCEGKHLNILKKVSDEDIELLEKSIDKMTEKTGEFKHFILPGGLADVAYCHICRTSARNAERTIINLAENEILVDENIIPYINRLSDYFFVLSLYLADLQGYEQTKA